MHASDPANVELFLTIGVPLLPILWIVLALQTTWLRSSFGSAFEKLEDSSGTVNRAKGNFRAAAWAIAIAVCFVTGFAAELTALAMILFGSQTELRASAILLFVPLILTLALSSRAMYRQIFSSH